MEKLLEEKLNQLSDDPYMVEAVKVLFLLNIESEKPIITDSDEDKLIGEKYRAYEKAKDILNKSLKDIEAYKTSNRQYKNTNKGK